jgi:hypothetical protein
LDYFLSMDYDMDLIPIHDNLELDSEAGLHASKGIQLNTHYFWQKNYVYMYMLCTYTKIL